MALLEPIVNLDEERRKRAGADASERALPQSDEEARAWLDGLMRQHGNRLAGYFTFKLHDEDIAQDLVIETFYRAWRARRSFRGNAKASTWLWTISRRVLAAHFEQKSRRAPEVLTDSVPEQVVTPAVEEERTRRRALIECFEVLNERIQRSAELVWLLGHSFVEAAGILEESPDTVRMRLKRARVPLQRCLSEKGVIGAS